MVSSNPVTINVTSKATQTLEGWLAALNLSTGNVTAALAFLQGQGITSVQQALAYFANLGQTTASEIYNYIMGFITPTPPVVNPKISVSVVSWPDISVIGSGFTPTGAVQIVQQTSSSAIPTLMYTATASSNGSLDLSSVSIILTNTAYPSYIISGIDVVTGKNAQTTVNNPDYTSATPQFVDFTIDDINVPYSSPQPLGSKANPQPAYNLYSSQYQFYWWVSKSKENAQPITSQAMFNAYNQALGFS